MVDVTASSKTDLHWKLKSGFTRFELIEVNVVFSERNCFFYQIITKWYTICKLFFSEKTIHLHYNPLLLTVVSKQTVIIKQKLNP